MKKLTILLIIITVSCQTQKFDTIIFKSKEKMSVVITDETNDTISYHLPFDTTSLKVNTRNLRMVKFGKPRLTDGVQLHTIKYRGSNIIFKGFF
jgi:hypothetical protein